MTPARPSKASGWGDTLRRSRAFFCHPPERRARLIPLPSLTRRALLTFAGTWIALGFGSGWDPALTPAATATPLSILDLAVRATVVVIGEVVAVSSEWNAAGTVITTVVEVRAQEVLKGSRALASLRVRQLGGQVGDVRSVVAGAPAFAVAERVLLFLTLRPDGDLAVAGLFQGKFSLTRDAGGREVAVRDLPGGGARDAIPLDDARELIRRAVEG